MSDLKGMEETSWSFEEQLEEIWEHDPALAKEMRRYRELLPIGILLFALEEFVASGNSFTVADLEEYRDAIVLKQSRPVYSIVGTDIQYNDVDRKSAVWIKRLDGWKDNIKHYFPSVGRIDINNNNQKIHMGTGWFICDDIVATAGHVADKFSTCDKNRFIMLKNGQEMKVSIDMSEEEDRDPDPGQVFEIAEVLQIEDGIDLAFLRVRRGDIALPGCIPLCETPIPDYSNVVTIGYPGENNEKNNEEHNEVMRRIFRNVYRKKRISPRKFIGQTDSVLHHNCCTLRGSSGSVVMNPLNGEALGLHFAGIYTWRNFAVPAALIRERLDSLKARLAGH